MNDDKLFAWLASVKGDPLAFVMGAFPWNEPGTVLENSSGPEQWACDLMNRIRDGLISLYEPPRSPAIAADNPEE